MSVLCKNQLDNQFRAFVKGSPEKIAELSLASSLPANYNDVMEKYTRDGYRLIAIATKAMPELNYRKAQMVTREQVECDLEFVGMLIMENKLKPQTSGVIKNLNDCRIRTVMATGDNMLTAISVARQCNILKTKGDVWLGDIEKDFDGQNKLFWKRSYFDEGESSLRKSLLASPNARDSLLQSPIDPKKSLFKSVISKGSLPWSYDDATIEVALTGPAFAFLNKNRDQMRYAYESVLKKAQVFARCSPEGKAELVTSMQ